MHQTPITPTPAVPRAPAVLLAPFARAVYVTGAMLVAIPLFDFLTSVLPMHPGSAAWRFASLGILSGFLFTPLLGLVLALGVATLAQHARPKAIAGAVCAAAAVGCMVALLVFGLDVLRLRHEVRAEALAAYQLSVLRVLAKFVSSALAFAMLGWAAFAPSPFERPLSKGEKQRLHTDRRRTLVTKGTPAPLPPEHEGEASTVAGRP